MLKRDTVLLVILIFSLPLFFCGGVFGGEQKSSCIVLDLPTDKDGVAQKIASFIGKPFFLHALTCEADIHFSPQEFAYLSDLKEGALISSDDIERAVSYLVKKNKFKTITLILCPAKEGKHLTIRLTAFWTFKKVTVSGVLWGKDEYRKYYVLESGDPFDQEKHMHSLYKIRDLLATEGYFLGKVVSKFHRDEQTKSLGVDIRLDKGPRFSIGSVNFLVNRSSLRHIDNLFLKRFRGNYSRSLIDREARAIKAYLAKLGFLHCNMQLKEKINRDSRTVDLTLLFDAYSKKEFVFFGNNFFSDAQLLERVLLFGRSAWLVPASILSQEICKAYKDKGFWNIIVDSREEPQGYFFLIQEGKRAVIDQIEFVGVNHVDVTVLQRNCFLKFLRAKYFDARLMKSAFDLLVSFYLKEGFWDAQILRHDFVPLEDGRYKLVVTVDEGDRTFLTSVTIGGFDQLLSKGPFKQLKKDSLRIPFDMRLIGIHRAWLFHYFKSKHNDVVISHHIEREGDDAALYWEIKKEEQPITFGKTVLQGSNQFPFSYLLRELQYKEGDLWDKNKLKQSMLKLRKMDIFDHVYLSPYPNANKSLKKDIVCVCQTPSPFEVRLRFGFGLQEVSRNFAFGRGVTYKVGGTFFYRNPFNVGDNVLADIDITRSYRNIFFSYGRPWIFNLPISTVYKVYANRYEQPGFVGSDSNLYQVTQEGFLVGLQRAYPKVSFSVNIGVEWMETSIKKDMKRIATKVSSAINFESKLLEKKMPSFLCEPTLLVDMVDNKLNPTIGTLTLLSLKGMFPLSSEAYDLFFLKLLFEQSLFYPFGDHCIGALRFRFGHMFHQRFKNIMPIERFYLGGANSIRSYETDLCPPLGVFRDCDNVVRVAPQGGKTMVNVNLECRVSIASSFGVVLFQDLGTLLGDRFSRSNVLAGTGLGIRINTPIGPLRFDIAWKWRYCKRFESSYAWFLVFGNAF